MTIARDYSRKPKCIEPNCPKYAVKKRTGLCQQHYEASQVIETLTPEEQEELIRQVHLASLNDLQLLGKIMTETPGGQRPERLLKIARDTGYAPEEQEE